MKLIYSAMPLGTSPRKALDDLFENVQAALHMGSDLYQGPVGSPDGIGQMVGHGYADACEYQLIAEKDAEVFNQKLADYTLHEWQPHLQYIHWQGYFVLWVYRIRNNKILFDESLNRVRALVEDVPSFQMVERAEKLLSFSSLIIPSKFGTS